MIERMIELLRSKDLCVLATASGGAPHCSLMAYVPAEDGRSLYTVTRKDTTKFENLRENPRVSLLVDTRDRPDENPTRALTVAGRCEPMVPGEEEKRARAALTARHPRLSPILEDAESVILRIRIESFLLLDGPEEAHFETL
jgi:nitroimidazol reductase NimA-like FMN-containing flavoprotein (pyridoxamine 5'-phosphate oxidase superfamily)